jgi:hypothetical protein
MLIFYYFLKLLWRAKVCWSLISYILIRGFDTRIHVFEIAKMRLFSLQRPENLLKNNATSVFSLINTDIHVLERDNFMS